MWQHVTFSYGGWDRMTAMLATETRGSLQSHFSINCDFDIKCQQGVRKQ